MPQNGWHHPLLDLLVLMLLKALRLTSPALAIMTPHRSMKASIISQ